MSDPITPNMGLTVPTIGVTPDPLWASEGNTNDYTLDGHDHTMGKGLAITTAALNINADVPWNNFRVGTPTEGVLSMVFTQQSAIPPESNAAWFKTDGNFWVNVGDGTPVQITNGHVINNSSPGWPPSSIPLFWTGGTTLQLISSGAPGFSPFYGSLKSGPISFFEGGVSNPTLSMTLSVPATIGQSQIIDFPAYNPPVLAGVVRHQSGGISQESYSAPDGFSLEYATPVSYGWFSNLAPPNVYITVPWSAGAGTNYWVSDAGGTTAGGTAPAGLTSPSPATSVTDGSVVWRLTTLNMQRLKDGGVTWGKMASNSVGGNNIRATSVGYTQCVQPQENSIGSGGIGTPIALATGWFDTSPSSNPCFFKDIQSQVRLQGQVENTGGLGGATICTLPAGYIPGTRRVFNTWSYDPTFVTPLNRLYILIDTSGNVKLQGPTGAYSCAGAGEVVSLDGLTFYAGV